MQATFQSICLQNNHPVKTQYLFFRFFEKVLFVFTVISVFSACCLYAQGLASEASIIVQNKIGFFVNGNLEVNASFKLNGTVHLTGDFIDNHGVHSEEGELRFYSNDLYQNVSGSAISMLNDLIIEEGAEVHLGSHKQITVNGLLTNRNSQGGLVLLSDNSGTASLIHYTAGIPGVVKHFFPPSETSNYAISSPVSYQSISPEFYTFGDGFFAWYEPAQTYVSVDHEIGYPTFADANQGKDYFLTASGYYVRYVFPDNQGNPKSFTGQMHQGKIDFILSRKAHDQDNNPGLNMMGNPYPSAIDWLAPEGWYGKEYLEGNKLGVAWVWNSEFQNFGVIHPASNIQYHNGINNIIPSKHGFFVQAASGNDGKILSMDDRVRVHNQSELVKGDGTEIPGEVLRMTVACLENGYQDEIILEYGHQHLMTAKKLLSPNPESPQIYICKDGKKISLILLPETNKDQEFFAKVRTPTSGLFSLEVFGADMDHMIEIVNNQTNKHLTVSHNNPLIFKGVDSSSYEIRVSRTL